MAFPWLDLPERHAEQNLHGEASLDRVRRENSPPDCFLILLTAIVGLSAPFAGRCGFPSHAGIKPALRRLKPIAYRPTDRQRPTTPERFIVGRPVPRCPIPDVCIDERRLPLFIARATLRDLIAGLEARATCGAAQ